MRMYEVKLIVYLLVLIYATNTVAVNRARLRLPRLAATDSEGRKLSWYCRRGSRVAICHRHSSSQPRSFSRFKSTNPYSNMRLKYQNTVLKSSCTARTCLNGLCSGNSCHCKAGWTGKLCNKDVNECIARKKPCQHICSNNKGSFKCSCRRGFVLKTDGKTCEGAPIVRSVFRNNRPAGILARSNSADIDLDGNNHIPSARKPPVSAINIFPTNYLVPSRRLGSESSMNLFDGHQRWCRTKKCQYRCVLKSGKEQCVCPGGLRLMSNGRTCADLNECYNGGKSICPINQECKNTFGSFSCKCRKGYAFVYLLSGKVCRDVNECLNGEHKCHLHSRCENTAGSYTCLCSEGYTGDGIHCRENPPLQTTMNKYTARNFVPWRQRYSSRRDNRLQRIRMLFAKTRNEP